MGLHSSTYSTRGRAAADAQLLDYSRPDRDPTHAGMHDAEVRTHQLHSVGSDLKNFIDALSTCVSEAALLARMLCYVVASRLNLKGGCKGAFTSVSFQSRPVIFTWQQGED